MRRLGEARRREGGAQRVVVRFAQALKISTDELLGVEPWRGEDDRPSLRLVRRLKKIEKLPAAHQKTILKTIDIFVKGADP